MVAQKIDTFGGMVPAVDKRLLQPSSADHIENGWVYSGRLQGFPALTQITTLNAATQKVFRLPNGQPDAQHIDDSTWLEFEDPDTDVLRGAVIGDTYDRYYAASPTAAPKYNTRARLDNNDDWWLLGVPQPDAPSITSTSGGSSSIVEVRAYCLTWVTTYGEEGPASDPVLDTGLVDDTWALSLTPPDSDDMGVDRTIANTRIYRTITGADGVTVFFMVAEVAASTTSYNDTLSDDVVSLNSQLESTNWIGPPSDLEGFVAMPNGIFAGWRENEIWFSEPYRPHAWPAAYSIVVDYPIVGMGVTNQTLMVLTQGYPVGVSGIHPATMAQSISKSLEPCLARGSILSTTEGVYYASPNGLVLAGGGMIKNLTTDLVTKDKWNNFVTVPSLRAARLGTAYYAFGSHRSGMFDPLSFDALSFAQEDFTGAYAGIMIDPANGRVGFNLLSSTLATDNVLNDTWSGETLIIRDSKLWRVDLSTLDPIRQVYIWRSKMFQTRLPENLAAMRIYWDVPDGGYETPGTAPAEAGDSQVEFPSLTGTYGVVRVYADDVLVMTRQLIESGELIRLPSGFKADFYQFEFETYVDIWSVQIGSSAKALKSA